MFFEVIAVAFSSFKSHPCYVYTLLHCGLPPELATLSQLGYGNSYFKASNSCHSLTIPLSMSFSGRSRWRAVTFCLHHNCHARSWALHLGKETFSCWYSVGIGPQLLTWLQCLLQIVQLEKRDRGRELPGSVTLLCTCTSCCDRTVPHLYTSSATSVQLEIVQTSVGLDFLFERPKTLNDTF